MQLQINGTLELNFTTLDGKAVSKETEQEITQKLENGDYSLGLVSMNVCSLENIGKPIYKAHIVDVFDWTEYSFEQDEE